jgi:hypothetical protein
MCGKSDDTFRTLWFDNLQDDLIGEIRCWTDEPARETRREEILSNS